MPFEYGIAGIIRLFIKNNKVSLISEYVVETFRKSFSNFFKKKMPSVPMVKWLLGNTAGC